ncbi:Common central domain of tyrosinase [Rhizoctonia solani]|uniref:Common central domain of tyrosinase n=1 Tax=Rhizoctonia solani TaxID=456999 RepID=A0A8H7IJH3_9AGAM|nr:Common central domain of tyrosinase [Rhizoctonia solani]
MFSPTAIHYVANFLPWHRWFLHLRRLDLADCGYTGPVPYWDWTIDSGQLATSNIWDPVSGFGGNGNTRTSARCVENGPYASPGFQLTYPNRHCLARRFNNGNIRDSRIGNMQGSLYSQNAVDTLMRLTDYINFSNDMEEGVHDVIHNVIAGDMAAAFSPNDALFFLHHQNIDRLWAKWQGRNAARLQDYRGNTVQGQDPINGGRYPLAKLTDKLPTQGIRGLPDITVAEVMDTMSDKLCYVSISLTSVSQGVKVRKNFAAYHTLFDLHSLDLPTSLMKFFGVLIPLAAAVLAVPSKSEDAPTPKYVSYVAAFLPWHRYFSRARGQLMKQCGYDGPDIYWDWTKDVNNMESSEMFDPVKGFGGTGKQTKTNNTTLNCVNDGPYGLRSNFTTWWDKPTSPSTRHSQTQIDNINKKTKFADFWPALEEGPHDSVHNEINNDMAASFSPDDVLFFLHHNNIDRLWALWQDRDQNRLKDYSGSKVQGQNLTDPTRPAASLDNIIFIGMENLGFRNVTVGELMNTQGPVLCYKYDK